MPRTFKYITALLALAGSLSLVASGELNPVFMIPGLAIIPGYYRFIHDEPPAPWWAIGGLSILTLMMLGFEIAVVREDYLVAIGHMTITFQAVKGFDMKNPWDTLQVVFMSLLQLIISSELSLSILFGFVFVVFQVFLMVAIVFSHFIKEGTVGRVRFRRPLIYITLSVFALTVIFFILTPRLSGGYFGAKHPRGLQSVGFTEEVDLGSFGRVLRDQTVVMRVDIDGPRLPLYWRGVTLNEFDGLAWRETMGDNRNLLYRWWRTGLSVSGFPSDPDPNVAYTVQTITTEPMDTDVVFGLGTIKRLQFPAYQLQYDNAKSYYVSSKRLRRFSYTVHSVPWEEPQGAVRSEYHQLPEGMGYLSGIVMGVVSPTMDEGQKARAIEAHLRNNYRYSLETTKPAFGVSPLEHFLLHDKQGYCEHYSTAMAMMLRVAGIPSRLVTGYMGGQENEYGNYIIVRQSNAHSWVEALIGGRWKRFDPTPIAPPLGEDQAGLYLDSLRMLWYRYVIGFSTSDQQRLVGAMNSPMLRLPAFRSFEIDVTPLYLAVVGGALLVAFIKFPVLRMLFAALGAGGRRVPHERRAYMKFRRLVRRGGGRVDERSTSREVLTAAREMWKNMENIKEFIELYERAAFSSETPSPETSRRMNELLRRFKSRKSIVSAEKHSG